MTEFVLILAVGIITVAAIIKVANRIPKKGRCATANGTVVEARITNENRTAEKAVVMKLVDSQGKKYSVKVKDCESKKWIKGDSVKIALSEDGRNYRVLFNDYFRANEERFRKNLAEVMKKKISPYFIAARLTGYEKNSPEAMLSSGAESLVMFVFLTYMKRITYYSIFSFLMTCLFLGWAGAFAPSLKQMLMPLILLVITYIVIYGSVMSCKKILAKFTK